MVALCVSHRIQRWVPLTAANAADGRWVLGVATGLRVTGQDDTPSFVRVPQLSDDDVQQIVETTAKRVVRLLQRRGVLEEGNVDPLWEDEPLLATITAASVQGQIATGARAGQRVRRRLLDPEEGVRSGPLCFASRGFSKRGLSAPHAATRVEATDRIRLEQLCRYVIRPPLAAGRLRISIGSGARSKERWGTPSQRDRE